MRVPVGTAATLIVLGSVSVRDSFEYNGDKRTKVGRLEDASGRPLSSVDGLFQSPLGLQTVTVFAPDAVLDGVQEGAVYRLSGQMTAEIKPGSDRWAAMRVSINGVDEAREVGELSEILDGVLGD